MLIMRAAGMHAEVRRPLTPSTKSAGMQNWTAKCLDATHAYKSYLAHKCVVQPCSWECRVISWSHLWDLFGNCHAQHKGPLPYSVPMANDILDNRSYSFASPHHSTPLICKARKLRRTQTSNGGRVSAVGTESIIRLV